MQRAPWVTHVCICQPIFCGSIASFPKQPGHTQFHNYHLKVILCIFLQTDLELAGFYTSIFLTIFLSLVEM